MKKIMSPLLWQEEKKQRTENGSEREREREIEIHGMKLQVVVSKMIMYEVNILNSNKK